MLNKEILGTKCSQGKELEILHSAAGYFVGTMDIDEEFSIPMPGCRMSCYYKSMQELEESKVDIRDCAENNFCNKGMGCLKWD